MVSVNSTECTKVVDEGIVLKIERRFVLESIDRTHSLSLGVDVANVCIPDKNTCSLCSKIIVGAKSSS